MPGECAILRVKKNKRQGFFMKQKIYETSIALFEKAGFSNTSIQDIVNCLGVTKGTFYYYFQSKEQLLMNIHLDYMERLLTQQHEILRNETLDNRAKVYELVYMLLRNIETQGTNARVFFREMRHLNKENLEFIKGKRDQIRTGMTDVIKAGIKEGEFRKDLNPEIVALGILGACNWSYNWFNPEGEFSDQEVARIYIDMILHGIET